MSVRYISTTLTVIVNAFSRDDHGDHQANYEPVCAGYEISYIVYRGIKSTVQALNNTSVIQKAHTSDCVQDQGTEFLHDHWRDASQLNSIYHWPLDSPNLRP